MLLVGLALFTCVWLTLLAYTSMAPPVDNIEQLTWVRSLEWGYYKHPPLTTWLFWVPARLLGLNAWTTYLTGAAFTLGAILLQWRLLKELRGVRYATLAIAAVLCITYYNDRLYYYNHNVVLMFFATAALYLSWRALSTGKLAWWAALGVAVGLGSLAKYQMAVALACVMVHWIHIRGWRDQAHRTGFLLAGLIALVIFVPHVQWLRTHDFGPVEYAMQSSLGAQLPRNARWLQASKWVLDQLLNRAMPAWLLLALPVFCSRRLRLDDRLARPGELDRPRPERAGYALLVIWGLVPLVFIPALGIVFGADLQLQWGTSFLLFAVPAAMEMLGSPQWWLHWRLRPVMHTFLVLQVVMLAVNFTTSARGPALAQDTHWRAFPAQALAQALQGPARAALGGLPICVVSGPPALAGALALELPERPLVLIDGRYDRSPWVQQHRARPCGVLEVSEGARYAQQVGAQFRGLTWRAILWAPANTQTDMFNRRS
jgi:4-amino-4-deoxy-L-arabinose transferase-like glycosyltransferase